MEYAKSYTSCQNGMDTSKIMVQAHIANGLPNFNIVGLGDKAVSESKERVRAAFSSLNISLPAKRITINLAPANLQKEGTHYDLAIALSILAAGNIIKATTFNKYIIHGELSLDGKINPSAGILPACIFANKLNKGFICSKDNSDEAIISGHKNLIFVNDLLEIIRFFKGEIEILPNLQKPQLYAKEYKDFSDVKGMNFVKRAVEIAAAGKHNLLMVGSPGTGKSMIAERIPSILPELSSNEILENCMIKSISNMELNDKIDKSIPFRAPHHSASLVALTGGGRKITPGEISLAHNGILFLDELPEFQASSLEALRQPLENKSISIARADRTVNFPANFQLISAMNPCRCGYYQIPSKRCTKAPLCTKDYIKKISGPLMERIDMIINIPDTDLKLFNDDANKEENSNAIRSRVIHARNRQKENLKQFNIDTNSDISLNIFEENIKISVAGKELLKKIKTKYTLSIRNIIKILRVAKTISDMENSDEINEGNILEALGYKKHSFF